MSKKPMTIQEFASMGGKARWAKLDKRQRHQAAQSAAAVRNRNRCVELCNRSVVGNIHTIDHASNCPIFKRLERERK